MVVILDIECNWIEKKMIIKELAFIDVANPLDLKHYILKPSIPWENVKADDKKRNSYCYYNIHHIPYELGDNELCELDNIFEDGTKIIVTGREKAKIIQSLFPKCSVQDYNMRNLSELLLPYLHIKCPFGNHSTNHCAVFKVYKLYHLNSLYYGNAKRRNFFPIQRNG